MKLFFHKAKEVYNSNKYLKVGLRVLISVVLIYYLVSTQDLNLIKENLLKFNVGYLFVVLGTWLVGTYISALRWGLILKTSNREIPTLKLYTLYLKGYFYNNFLPTQMGGDVYKAVAAGSMLKDQSLGFFSVFMDRFGGLIALLILGLFGIASLLGVQWVILSIVALGIGFYLYFPVLKLFSKKIKFFQKFEDASNLLIKDKTNAILIIFYSFLVQFISFTGTYILFLGMNISLPLWSVTAFMPIANLSSLIPSFNGFGTQETVFAFLFRNAGVTPEISIAVSVILHIVRLMLSIIGGLFIMLNIPRNDINNLEDKL